MNLIGGIIQQALSSFPFSTLPLLHELAGTRSTTLILAREWGSHPLLFKPFRHLVSLSHLESSDMNISGILASSSSFSSLSTLSTLYSRYSLLSFSLTSPLSILFLLFLYSSLLAFRFHLTLLFPLLSPFIYIWFPSHVYYSFYSIIFTYSL